MRLPLTQPLLRLHLSCRTQLQQRRLPPPLRRLRGCPTWTRLCGPPRPGFCAAGRHQAFREAPRAGNTLTPPAPAHCLQSPSPAQVERPTLGGFSTCTSAPCPLSPPTMLIIGDSITRYIRFFSAITHCFPGATVPVILDKLLNLLPSLPSLVTKIVLHVG
ncbi:uncharacterized protein LOC126383485 isoform X2 [Xyrichtys novacula]|uniref:Uncharacterized protein LOC126383485 isoform X2 n=1 Tax=Xyrichtys novacula TaxID=13765 RepID=A0AAV1F490_XYRNO|nr:uncharacterized protein LOC126383485 isoform X2 [Xyrichtys novacula]